MSISPVAMSSISRPTLVSVPPTSTIPPTKTSVFSLKTQQPQQQTTIQYQDLQQSQKTMPSHQKHIPMDGVKSNHVVSHMPTLTTIPNFSSLPTNTLMSSTKVHQHPQASVFPSKVNQNSIKGNSFIQQQQTTNSNINLAQNITIGTTTDPSCDSYDVCYQVSLRCTDSRISVQVKTSRPFHGRIYALGRSETCNNKVHNSQHFNLEMPLTGQQCNTQNVQGVYSNTVVLQHHNVVLTKADKVSSFLL